MRVSLWECAFKYFSVDFKKVGVSLRKEYKIVSWNCQLHSYNKNSHLHNLNRNSHVHNTLQKYHLHNCNPDSTCIITIKMFAHIFAAETFTCTSTTETSNCMNGTETVTCIIATERSTNISMTESTTCITGIEPQELHNCNRCCHQHEYYRKCQLHSCNRNCHLQNWPQKLLLAEMVPVRDSFSYNKEVEWMAKD